MKEQYKYLLLNLPFYLAVIILLFYKGNGSSGITKTTVTKDSSIVYLKDTAKHSDVRTYLQPINNTYIVDHPAPIDTAKLIHDYYTKRFYRTITGDSLIQITTNDTVYNNSIGYKKTTWQFLKPYATIKTFTTTITNEIEKTKGVYIGLFASFNKTVYGFGPEANFIFKQNNIGVGYDFLNRGGQVKYLRKIGKK